MYETHQAKEDGLSTSFVVESKQIVETAVNETIHCRSSSDDVIHEKVQERRRRLVINMYVDSFMAS